MIKGSGINHCFAYAGKVAPFLFFLFSNSNNCNDVFTIRADLEEKGMK